MSWTKTYPITATANDEVNIGVLQQQILDDVTITGTLEAVSMIEMMADFFVIFVNPLPPLEEAALDALVAAHIGEDYAPGAQRMVDLTTSSNATNVNAVKLSAQVMLPLAAGDYTIAFICESRLESLVANAGVEVSILVNGIEVAQDAWNLDQWHIVSGAGLATFKAGNKPLVQIVFRRIGAAANAQVRRARLALILEQSN